MVENLFLARSLWPNYCVRQRLRILRGLLSNDDQCTRKHNPFSFFNRSGNANGEKYLKDKQLKERIICRKETFPKTYHELSVGYLSGWLMNYWLRNCDRAHFGVPIESRRPFLDYRLVEYVLTLPPEYLLYRGWTKYILRKSFEDIVPEAVIWNRQKRGMPFNTLEWFSHAKPIIQKHLLSVQDNPFLDVTAFLNDYDRLVQSDPTLLWRNVCLGLWWKASSSGNPCKKECAENEAESLTDILNQQVVFQRPIVVCRNNRQTRFCCRLPPDDGFGADL